MPSASLRDRSVPRIELEPKGGGEYRTVSLLSGRGWGRGKGEYRKYRGDNSFASGKGRGRGRAELSRHGWAVSYVKPPRMRCSWAPTAGRMGSGKWGRYGERNTYLEFLLEMLTSYIRAAMRQAKYEILADDRTFYAEVPEFAGVYSNADNLETCRTELEEVLEEWILFRVSRNLPLPIVDGIELTIKEVV